MSELEVIDADAFIEMAHSGIPVFYANGMANALSGGDLTTIFQRNGRAAFVLNMSFTTAKTYSILLGQIIAELEAKGGQEIMTSQHITSVVQAPSAPSNEERAQ